jgi:F-type H+-transporting ATPase subunit epsilon
VPVEVHLVTPDREVWSGEADLLIARGVDGEVGIQRGHMPLLVQLAIGPLHARQVDGSDVAAVVDGGFLHISGDGGSTRADVLASSAELASEIDLEAARQRVAELEAFLARPRDTAIVEAELAAAKVALKKARERVSLVG